MFERPILPGDIQVEDIVNNVRELCKLDPVYFSLPFYLQEAYDFFCRMFVSRTIAAEVCMEAKSNEVGYNALKELDKSGHLRFELSYVLPPIPASVSELYFRTLVEDLLRVRSV
jgi:hypothetical protein